MTDQERRAKQFAADWAGRGDEKQESQTFWLSLLQKVYGIAEPEKFIQFEVPVKLSHTMLTGYPVISEAGCSLSISFIFSERSCLFVAFPRVLTHR